MLSSGRTAIFALVAVVLLAGCSDDETTSGSSTVTSPRCAAYYNPVTKEIDNRCTEALRNLIDRASNVAGPDDVVDAGKAIADLFDNVRTRLSDSRIQLDEDYVDEVASILEANPAWRNSDQAATALDRLRRAQVVDDLADAPIRRAIMNLIRAIG